MEVGLGSLPAAGCKAGSTVAAEAMAVGSVEGIPCKVAYGDEAPSSSTIDSALGASDLGSAWERAPATGSLMSRSLGPQGARVWTLVWNTNTTVNTQY